MNARIFLLTLGLLGLTVVPGCCLLHGCGCGSGCGYGCGLADCIHKIRDKIHNCSLCKKSNCCGDCGCSCGGMAYGYGGEFAPPMISDCGCGAPSPGCGCASGGMPEPAPFMTPPMTVPSMHPVSPTPTPSPAGSIPPLPPAESSSTAPVPQGMQQVSMEEFQRLPGVIISGPGAQPTASPGVPQMAQPTAPTPVPANIAAPTPAAKPIQQASGAAMPTITPSMNRQVQQTGWAPVRQ